MQNVATIIKVASSRFWPCCRLSPSALNRSSWDVMPDRVDQGLLVGIGVAMAAIMWAYDGWGNVTVIAEEVAQPAA